MARIISQLRQAMQATPFLIRLPSEGELAKLCNASLREVRRALASLVDDGYLSRGRTGCRVRRRTPQRDPLRTVVVVDGNSGGISPFGPAVTMGIDHACMLHGLTLDSRIINFVRYEDEIASLAASLPVEDVGLVLLRPPSHELADRWIDEGRRFVLLDGLLHSMVLPAVLLNYEQASEIVHQLLDSRGHRLSAFACHAGTSISQYLYPAGRFDTDLCVVFNAYKGHEGVVRQARQWIAGWRKSGSKVTAIVIHNIADAVVFAEVCRACGVDIPGELSLIGFGCLLRNDLAQQYPITLVSTGTAKDMGASAVDLLLQPDVMQTRPVKVVSAAVHNSDLTVRSI